MPTQVFKQFPWIGGLNTTQDSSVIPQNQLVTADNIIFGERGSRKSRPGINFDWDDNDFIIDKTVTAASNPVTVGTDTITLANHGFSDGNCIKYSVSVGGTAIPGLTSGAYYYVVSSVANTSFKLSLYRGGLAVDLTDQGVGTHTFSRSIDLIGGLEYSYGTTTKSSVIVSLAEESSLYSYSSSGSRTTVAQYKIATSSAGLVTEASDLINISSHGFSTGDAIYYQVQSGGVAITGLTTNTLYYVYKNDANSFKLATTYANATASTPTVIDLTDDGSGTHYFGVTPFTGTTALRQNSMCVIGNHLIVCADGLPVRKWTNGTGTMSDLSGNAPDSPFCAVHLGRLFLLDPTRKDRLHYSTTGNIFEWGGEGDSGVIDVGTQDGDKSGITGFFSFKGVLFVMKRTKLYRVTGNGPENFYVELISQGVGCIAHNSIAYIDQDDVFWASDRGIHSLSATSNYGDFEGKFISVDIQKSFNDTFSRGALQYISSVYMPTINSVVYAVNQTGDTANNDLWLFNIPLNSWYRWPDISCGALISVQDSDKRRLYFGDVRERLAQGFISSNYDTTYSTLVSATPATTPIYMEIKTGTIYPDGSPELIKGFKRFSIIYKKDQTHSIRATLKIDNYPNQSLTFEAIGSGALLGSSFILGQSRLGFSGVLAPYTFTIDGYGRGITITLTQNTSGANIEIWGFQIEWEPGELVQEVIE